ncbi:hypothetical protein BSL78_13012 [Apostichopus japonicus]|uniref:Uncharacterized protein n=1 Tax=Stichopus japonicus TaxID=307972 RepID=A0A2G8KPZ8_STIJA|nr:hypothetical protein BSL78_13012 [Apostichopus japonicus]
MASARRLYQAYGEELKILFKEEFEKIVQSETFVMLCNRAKFRIFLKEVTVRVRNSGTRDKSIWLKDSVHDGQYKTPASETENRASQAYGEELKILFKEEFEKIVQSETFVMLCNRAKFRIFLKEVTVRVRNSGTRDKSIWLKDSVHDGQYKTPASETENRASQAYGEELKILFKEEFEKIVQSRKFRIFLKEVTVRVRNSGTRDKSIWLKDSVHDGQYKTPASETENRASQAYGEELKILFKEEFEKIVQSETFVMLCNRAKFRIFLKEVTVRVRNSGTRDKSIWLKDSVHDGQYKTPASETENRASQAYGEELKILFKEEFEKIVQSETFVMLCNRAKFRIFLKEVTVRVKTVGPEISIWLKDSVHDGQYKTPASETENRASQVRFLLTYLLLAQFDWFAVHNVQMVPACF